MEGSSLMKSELENFKRIKNLIPASLFIFLYAALFASIIWVHSTFPNISIDEIIFTLKTPQGDADKTILLTVFIFLIIFPLLLAVSYFLISFFLSPVIIKRKHKKNIQFIPFPIRFTVKKNIFFFACFLFLFLVFLQYKTCIINYVFYQLQGETDLYENYYTDPKTVTYSFPEKKKNLIFIYLESIEITATAKKYGGLLPYDTIPELRKIAEEHLSFSNSEKLGGFTQVLGATHTIASMVCSNLGVPLGLDPLGSRKNLRKNFCKGGYGLGDILADNGYKNIFITGANATFGYKNLLLKNHKDFEIKDYPYYIATGKLPQKYKVRWGFEDAKLFEFAKEELSNISDKGPFFLQVFTTDSHTPGGYLPSQYKREFKTKIQDVYRNASKMTGDFVAWLKTQNFYDNTVIVILGDHQYMGGGLYPFGTRKDERHAYNAIINSQATTAADKNRTFAAFDFCPTILEAMGIQFNAEKLGLGRSLFSGKKTLLEEIGTDQFNAEAQHRSSFLAEIIEPRFK
ncbi:LTA synthase family protein [Treponema phagedenis]|nr:LTA synthase family protein [Treponema phagedenis]